MSEGLTARTCDECGASLHLLQPTCDECGDDYEWSFVAPCLDCGRETEYLHGDCECGKTHSPWRVAERIAREEGSVTIAKDPVERPSRAGYSRHLGTIRGQWADYRREADDGTEFHVRTFLDHYELHVDDVSALEEPTMHTLRYGPAAAVTTGTDAVRATVSAAESFGSYVKSALRVPGAFIPDRDEH